MVREDISEEFDLLGVSQEAKRICDFGCGNGIITFGLALESEGSECIGVDLFYREVGIDPQGIKKHIEIEKSACRETGTQRDRFRKIYVTLLRMIDRLNLFDEIS